MFRVKFTDPDGTFWTAPIDNWAMVSTLVLALRERGLGCDVFVNDRQTHAEAQACHDAQPQLSMLSWGDAGKAKDCHCAIARVLCAGFDTASAKVTVLIADEQQPQEELPRDELPRDLAGPLPEEVAQHTPAILPLQQVQPLLCKSAAPAATWLDRLLGWLLGVPQGIEVSP